MEHELLDEYNSLGEIIGTVDKADAHKEGRWHRSVHVWVVNSKNEILLQYRSKEKSVYPSTWDCSFAGHVGAGESTLNALLREGKEELGLAVDTDKLTYILTNREVLPYGTVHNNELADIYILRQDVDLSQSVLQREEVAAAKFFSLEEFFAMAKTDALVPHTLEYEVLKGYLLPQ